MASAPLVSAVIAVYDGERYLGEAIESVRSQTYAPIEIVVVDDGSADGSAAVAASFDGLHLERQAHAGQAVALNRGCELVRGEFVAFLDADDLWEPEKIALQTAVFEEDPRLDVVFGHVRPFHSPELDPVALRRLGPLPGPGPAMLRSCMLIRRAALARVGPFDPRWRVGEFVDWYARAMESGLRSRMVPRIVTRRRVHTTNMVRRDVGERLDYVRIARAALERRRREAGKSDDSEAP